MHLALVLAALVSLTDGWQFAVTAPRETPPHDAAWREDFEIRRGFDVWFRNRLPQELPRDAHLVFRSFVGHFELFVTRCHPERSEGSSPAPRLEDPSPPEPALSVVEGRLRMTPCAGERFYTFHDPDARGRLRIHVVPIPAQAAGAQIYVRVIDPGGAPLVGRPTLAPRAEIARATQLMLLDPLRDDFGDLVIGMFLIVVGLLCIAASGLLRRGDTRALFWFGAMATLYGARLLADSYLPVTLGGNVHTWEYATAFITYVIPIAGWTLARHAIGDGWRGSLRWHVYAFIAFAPVGIVSDLVQRNPGSLELVNNILVITGGLNILFNLLHGRRWHTPELRAILAGSLIFMLFALNNNLFALGLLPWEIPESPGFLAFVVALGYAAMRTFLRGERARVALEGELAAAREIQRSILPMSMPAVAGLRVEAHYDPASSVAGDLYEFLEVDEARVGVLVADVSGHGVPAALIASMVKIAVSSQSRFAHEPGTLLREVNRTLRGQVRRAFVTATYLFFDTARGCVEVANAGHPPPLLCRGGDVRELGPRGVLLGRFDAQYDAETISLERGDRIVIYTDGVTEARNARGEEFGEARLRDMVRDGASADGIARAVRAWRDEQSDADDLTVLVMDLLD